MDAVQRVSTNLLDIAYLDNGPKEGPVVILLHGWPDDATTWAEVSSELTAHGFRTVAPWLRGFGGTTFRGDEIRRTGNSGMLALDAIALVDALGIVEFSVVGHDWGSNIAEALAVALPERVRAIVQLSSPPRLGGIKTPSFSHAQLEWYHWFQATKIGADAVKSDPIGFAKIMWDNWSPQGWYTNAEFEAVSKSWLNPDWVEVTLHSYRARWGEADSDPASLPIEKMVRATKSLSLPALYVQGQADGVNPPLVSETVYEKFTGPFKRVVLDGVGHFPTREDPDRLSRVLLEFLGVSL